MFATRLELATATHDLRNRLSVAACEVAELHRALESTRGQCDADLSDSLALLESSLAQANAVLEDILERARPGTDAGCVDLVALTRRYCCQEIRSVRVSVQANCDELCGMWSAMQLRHLLRLLLTNALQYSSPERPVLVTLDHDGDDALLRVTDRGSGIPPDDVAQVGKPFYRGRAVEGTVTGLGLGLATARRIAEQYAGSLEVQTATAVGTTVSVRLPV